MANWFDCTLVVSGPEEGIARLDREIDLVVPDEDGFGG
jgi:hypothetical protein